MPRASSGNEDDNNYGALDKDNQPVHSRIVFSGDARTPAAIKRSSADQLPQDESPRDQFEQESARVVHEILDACYSAAL
jgi:hypothetical protein